MGILLAGKRQDRRFHGVNSYLGEETSDTSDILVDICLNVGSKLLYGITRGKKWARRDEVQARLYGYSSKQEYPSKQQQSGNDDDGAFPGGSKCPEGGRGHFFFQVMQWEGVNRRRIIRYC